METANIIDVMMKVYWDTYLEYLIMKNEDKNWVLQNMEWLKKTTDIGLKVVNGMRSRDGFNEYLKVIEKNTELKKLLYCAWKKVFSENGKTRSKAA